MSPYTQKALGSTLTLFGYLLMTLFVLYFLPFVGLIFGVDALFQSTLIDSEAHSLIFGAIEIDNALFNLYFLSLFPAIIVGKTGMLFVGTGDLIRHEIKGSSQKKPGGWSSSLLWPISLN